MVIKAFGHNLKQKQNEKKRKTIVNIYFHDLNEDIYIH